MNFNRIIKRLVMTIGDNGGSSLVLSHQSTINKQYHISSGAFTLTGKDTETETDTETERDTMATVSDGISVSV